MPVKIQSRDDSEHVVTVEHICEGCGEKIREFEAFAGMVDEEIRPIHNSLDCIDLTKD